MPLSMRAKLFLTLVVAAVLAVAATQAFVHWSLLRNQQALAEARQQEHIAEIGERLAAIYARDNGWTALRQDKRLWLQALFGGPELGHGPGLGPGFGRRHGPLRRRLAELEPAQELIHAVYGVGYRWELIPRPRPSAADQWPHAGATRSCTSWHNHHSAQPKQSVTGC
jgi:two-component system sensor histidine kinase BaeS